jgi:hypothetical protein
MSERRACHREKVCVVVVVGPLGFEPRIYAEIAELLSKLGFDLPFLSSERYVLEKLNQLETGGSEN